jgi:hypothetical protein
VTTPAGNLIAVAAALRAQAAHGHVVLDGTVLTDAARAALRQAFGLAASADVTIDGVTPSSVVDAPDGSLLVTGGTAHLLGQPGLAVQLRCVTGEGFGDVVFALAATMPAGWRFATSFPGLGIFPFSDLGFARADFVHASAAIAGYPWPGGAGNTDTVALAAGLNFCGGADFGAFSLLGKALGQLLPHGPLRVHGPFAPTAGQALPVGALRAQLGGTGLRIGVAPNELALADPAIAVSIAPATDGSPLQDVDLLVEATFNETLDVAVGVPVSGGALLVRATPAPGKAAALDVIEALPGGKGVLDFAPAELKQVFSDVGLDNFSMVVDLSPRVTFVSLSVATTKVWSVIDRVLTLDTLRLRVDITDPAGQNVIDVRIDAQADFLPAIFKGRFVFTIELEKLDTWRIEEIGGAHYGAVTLADLVAGLTGSPGAVPAALREIAFSEFAVAVTDGGAGIARTYTIQGNAEAAFPIADAQLSANLSVTATKTSAGHTIDLSGAVLIGAAGFHIALDLGGADSSLAATWSAGDPNDGFVSLQHLLADLGVTAPDALSSVTLKAASLNYDFTTGSIAVSGDVEGKGKLPIGNLTYDVDLRVVVNSAIDPSTKQRVVSAHFESDLVIGPSTFEVSFNIGTVTNVVGLWNGGIGQPLTLTDIAGKLGIPAPSNLPAGLNLGLKAASFTYDATNHAFTLSAESVQFGDGFFVTARGADGNTGFVFGLDTPHAGHLSSLPAIGPELKAADVLTFQKVSFLVSSGTFKNFVVPTLPALPAPTAPGGPTAAGRPVAPLVHGASLQLSPGLSLAAAMTFSGGAADPRMANLASIVAQPTLVLQVSVGESLLRIFCALAGTVWIPAGGRNKLALSNPSVEIDITGVPPLMAVQMSGSVAFTALGLPITATARMIISEVEAEVACTIGADGSRISVPALGALPVGQLGVEMGAFFEPPGVDLGVQGQITIGEQARAFAVVLEMVGEAPNPLYLAFYINQANLFQVLTMFMPQLSAAAAGAAVLAPGIYNKAMQALSLVEAIDLSFHWCDDVVVLPDGTVAQPGLGFSAGITILSWSGFAQMELSAAQGVSGTCEMSAIDLRGVLRIDGDGAGIKRAAPPGGGPAKAAPNLQIVHSGAPAGQPVWIVPPGGPIFEVNAAGPDFLHANWKVSLFDAVRQSVDVTVTTTGFSFVMSFQAGSVVRFGLSCVLDGKALSFSASGTLVLQVSGSIGPIHVAGVSVGSISLPNVSVNASLRISLNTSMFSLGLQGSFQFQSQTLSVPEVDFRAPLKSVAELSGLMLRAIQQEADAIFKSLMGNVEKWADLAGRGVVTGVTDMADTLHRAYNVSAQDAARLMSVGKQSTETIALGLKSAYQQSNAQVATLLKGAGYTTRQIAQTFKNIGVSADETIGILRNTLGVPANEAIDAVKGVFTQTHVDVVVTPHIDTTQPPHGDASTPHGDTVQPPHGDTSSSHGDTTQPPHGDGRSPHVDGSSPHGDSHPFFHIDIGGIHGDMGGIHGDTPSIHVDVPSIHADTPSVHVDVKPFHTDTPSVHVDKAPIHTDTRI